MFERELPSYCRGTAVGGRFSVEEFNALIEEAKGRLSVEVDTYFNSRPIKGNLKVFPIRDERFMRLEEETPFPANIRDYLEGWSESEIKRYERQHNRYKTVMMRDVALLFPHHTLAFVLDNHAFKRIDEQCGLQGRLESLGYKVAYKRKETSKGGWLGAVDWKKENKDELLLTLRNPQLDFGSADSRAQEIVNTVNENVGAQAYTYGIFIPKRWVNSFYGDGGNQLRVSPVKKLVKVPAEWKNAKLEQLSWGLPLTRAIGLTSLIQTKKGMRHIPMIDFRDFSQNGYDGRNEVEEALSQIGMPGVIISSGASYHFYGFRALNHGEWIEYINSLKEIPGIDKNWPELQLKQGFSMLRLTPSKRKFSQPSYLGHFSPRSTGTEENTEIRKLKVIAA